MTRKPPDVRIFDGLKSLSLRNYESAWTDLFGGEDHGDVASVYRSVPYLYAATQARMEAVSATPWNLYPFGKKASESDPVTEQHPELVSMIEDLLPITEGALCLYGRAYWLVESNRYGRNVKPRYAVPTSINPRYDPDWGLVGFDRSYTNGVYHFDLDRQGLARGLVWFWLHSITAEESYDIAPAQVALKSARANGNLSEFVDMFLSRGAVKQTLLMVPEDTDPEEVENLRSWWQRIFRGSKSANQAEVLRQNVEAVTVGEGIGDLSNESLDQMLRRHIGTAFRVPESILVSSASNHAVSHQDWLTFWEICVKPEMKRLRRIINRQFLAPFELYMWEEPERLEFYQTAELEKAQSLSILVREGLIDVNEARDMLGYGGLPEDENETGSDVQLTEAILNSGALSVNELRARLGLEPVDTSADEQQRTLSRQFELLKQATDAGLSIEQAAEIIGINLPEVEKPEPESDPDLEAETDFEEMDAEAEAEFDEDEERDGGSFQEPPEGKSLSWLKHYELKRKPSGGGHWAKQPRDARGRFARMDGSGARQTERSKLKGKQQRERRELQERHKSEREALPRKERHTLKERHAAERGDLRQKHQVERASQRTSHMDQRQKEVDTHLAEMRKNNPKAMTRAYGNDPNKAYEMRTRVVDMGDVKASNTATGAINPDYDQTLQPRDRTRAASQQQIDNVARNMVSDAVLMDFHQIDKGSPIVDADGNVLSGNGRTLALQRMKERYPEKWTEYQESLRATAKEHGISDAELSQMKNPVLVRELVGDHDRVAFAREANNPPVLQMSPLERAKIERDLVSDRAINMLDVRDGESVDQALRRSFNQGFVQEFMGGLSDNERATMLRADGSLNRAGIERVKAAMYAKALPGASGERLADTFLESLDSDIKNFEAGISAQLPSMTRMQNMIARGDRNQNLDITGDMAGAIDVLARIREQGKMTVSEYLGQSQMFGERELSPQGERLLAHFDTIGRKPKAIREFIGRWAQEVENAPHPNQSGMFGDDGHISTDELIDRLLGEDNRQESMF